MVPQADSPLQQKSPSYALRVIDMLQLVSTVIIGPKAGFLPEVGKASDLPRSSVHVHKMYPSDDPGGLSKDHESLLVPSA